MSAQICHVWLTIKQARTRKVPRNSTCGHTATRAFRLVDSQGRVYNICRCDEHSIRLIREGAEEIPLTKDEVWRTNARFFYDQVPPVVRGTTGLKKR